MATRCAQRLFCGLFAVRARGFYRSGDGQRLARCGSHQLERGPLHRGSEQDVEKSPGIVDELVVGRDEGLDGDQDAVRVASALDPTHLLHRRQDLAIEDAAADVGLDADGLGCGSSGDL